MIDHFSKLPAFFYAVRALNMQVKVNPNEVDSRTGKLKCFRAEVINTSQPEDDERRLVELASAFHSTFEAINKASRLGDMKRPQTMNVTITGSAISGSSMHMSFLGLKDSRDASADNANEIEDLFTFFSFNVVRVFKEGLNINFDESAFIDYVGEITDPVLVHMIGRHFDTVTIEMSDGNV